MTNGVYGADGEQRNRGLEFNVAGEPLRGLRVLGGVTFLDAELTRGEPRHGGQPPVGVPKVSVSLSAEWDTPWVAGLTLTGSMMHTGPRVRRPGQHAVRALVDHLRPGARYAAKVYGKTSRCGPTWSTCSIARTGPAWRRTARFRRACRAR